jgi:hypothetical protein
VVGHIEFTDTQPGPANITSPVFAAAEEHPVGTLQCRAAFIAQLGPLLQTTIGPTE